MYVSSAIRRFLLSLVAGLVAAPISLAMAQVNGGISEGFLARWAVGWISLLLLLLPLAWWTGSARTMAKARPSLRTPVVRSLSNLA